MPGLTPSSPPNASATVRGLVSTLAQTFAGVKTFLARAVFQLGITAGLARLDLRSDLGAGATDVCSVVGSTVADGTVNANAILWAAATGIGSTEVLHLAAYKGGFITGGSAGLRLASSSGALLYFSGATLSASEFITNQGVMRSSLGAGGTDVCHMVGSSAADVSVSPTARLIRFVTAAGLSPVGKAHVTARGAYAIEGSIPLVSATGTPASTATQNAAKGRVTVPSGATSVAVTNDQLTADSFVSVEWEALPGVTHAVSYAAGSFTVTFSAALGSSLTFRYVVVR